MWNMASVGVRELATAAEGDLLEWLKEHPPLAPDPGKPLLSDILAEMRADER